MATYVHTITHCTITTVVAIRTTANTTRTPRPKCNCLMYLWNSQQHNIANSLPKPCNSRSEHNWLLYFSASNNASPKTIFCKQQCSAEHNCCFTSLQAATLRRNNNMLFVSQTSHHLFAISRFDTERLWEMIPQAGTLSGVAPGASHGLPILYLIHTSSSPSCIRPLMFSK